MSNHTFTMSFEFFPPATPEGLEKLRHTRAVLAALGPEFFSVTYGAGGSTQERTFDVVTRLSGDGPPVAPHLSCVGASREAITRLLDRYKEVGVRRLVALRGDMPSGMVAQGDLQYAADLVALIRAHSGDWFHIAVAGYPEIHPQAGSPDLDMDNLKRKVDAGASSIITQYFYNADAFFDFVERARRAAIRIPIIPGIMPILNYTQLARFSRACGAELPRWIEQRLASFHDDIPSLRAFGHEVVADLCQRLADHDVGEFHFYTLNQAEPAAALCRTLRG